jgi:hypothetical protein
MQAKTGKSPGKSPEISPILMGGFGQWGLAKRLSPKGSTRLGDRYHSGYKGFCPLPDDASNAMGPSITPKEVAHLLWLAAAFLVRLAWKSGV